MPSSYPQAAVAGDSMFSSRSFVLEPEAEAASSGGRMSHSAGGEPTWAKGAAWDKCVALGNVASSLMYSAGGLAWGSVGSVGGRAQ